MVASEFAPEEQALAQAGFDLISRAFAVILGLDAANITNETDFFEEGAGSLQIRALQDYLENDHGQERVLRQKLEQHVLFTNPKVGDIVRLLVENSKNMPKSDEELLEGARTVLKKAYSEILGLNEEDVTDDTDFFAAGGGSLQVRILIDYLKSDKGQDMLLQQANIEQHELFASPTVLAVAEILVENAKKGGNETSQTTIEHVAETIVLDNEKYYPASYAQEQTFFLDASGAGAAYNMPWIVDFHGKFNKDAMIRALDLVVKKEQPLRTVLRLNPNQSKRSDGTVQQRVLPIDESRNCWELSLHNAISYREAMQILEKEQDYTFDLTQTPISRLHIVKVSPVRHVVMCNSHHVHHDTGSVVIYRRHVMETFIAICRDESVDTPDKEATFDYIAYAVWQRQVLTSRGANYRSQLSYWKDELDGARALTFPKDPTANAQGGPLGGMVTLRLEPNVATKWKQCLSSHGCTPFMGGMMLYHIILSRWFNEKDIVSGAAIANRDPHPSYADRLGCFRNVLPIRTNRAGQDNPTYLEMLSQIKTKVIQSWGAKEIPYHLVIAGVGDKSFRGFNLMYAFQDAEWHTLAYDTSDLDLNAKVAYLNKNTTKFDVHLMLRWNADGGVDGDLIYSATKFGQATMQKVADAFVIMATTVAEQGPVAIADQKVLDLPMLSSAELTTVRDDWNKTFPETPYPVPTSVGATLLTAINAHNDNSIAIHDTFTGASYTYSEFRNNIYVVAAGIKSMVKKEHPRVAVIFSRGFEMYSTLLGVLSGGGCLVPIDASNTPVERGVFMINDSEADLIIYDKSNEEFVHQLENPGTSSYENVVQLGRSFTKDDQIMPPTVEVDSLAYILYTSGTTGLPKGVCISHANVHNSIYWWTNLVKLNPTDTFLHFSSFSFVMSIRQIYPILFVGGTLVSSGPSSEFESAVVKGNVTKMAITPSALATIDREKCTSLKVVQVAGEACPEKLANDWAKILDKFYIGLGPTELCGHACCGEFNVGDSVRIGFPVNNSAAYILNEAGQIQPPGVIGELCIAGSNVASGYLKRDEITKKHFVRNPFDADKPKMYKVGDLARRHIDGKIEFVGRSDDQVKIRGFRIELQEVVSALVSSGSIAEAHVLPSKVKGSAFLTAYVKPKIADEGEEGDDLMEKVKLHLNQSLPTYMIPTHIIPMEKFPLNKNGKLDRQQLPNPEAQAKSNSEEVLEVDFERESPIVEILLLVFAKMLKCTSDEVWKAINQSFFEIGGTSLSAVQSLRQLSEALSIDLKVMDLIRQPSILDFIRHTLKEVEESKSSTSRPATAMDLNVSFEGIMSKEAGSELNWTFFCILQALTMVGIVAFSVVVPLTVAVFAFLATLDAVGFPLILPLLPSIYGCMAVANLFITSCVVHLLPITKIPSSYPLSSLHFLKWSVHKKMTQLTVTMFWPANNTKLMTLVFKFLGANIGSDVSIDSAIVDIPSLVTIGNRVSVGFCTRIVCGEMRGDTLFICPVELAEYVKTEPRSSITPGSYVPSSCVVRSWACVTSTLNTSSLTCAKDLVGSPAILGEDVDKVSSHVPLVTQGYGYLLCQIVCMYIISIITFAGIGVSCVLGISLVKVQEGDLAQLLYFVIAGLPVAFLILLLVIIITKRTILNRPKEGVHHTGLSFYLRVWAIDTLLLSPLLALALEYLLPPSMHHYFLRAMGGKATGAHTFWNSPQLRAGCEHISIGEALHSGFSQIWDTQVVSAEGISFKGISIGDNCTLGQRTVVMPGCSLDEHVTCGSESIILQDMVVQPNGTVVGNPPSVFVSSQNDEYAVRHLQESIMERGQLPTWYEAGYRRLRSIMKQGQGQHHNSSQLNTSQIVSSMNDDGSVHIFNCIAIILNLAKLPIVVGVFVAYYHLIDVALAGSIGSDKVVLRACVTAFVTYLVGILSFALFLSFATLSGLASFQSGSSGYYTSRFIVWWFFMWFNRFCSGLLLYPFHGTFLFNMWLRLIGASIGSRCYIDPTAAGWFEMDGIEIEDDSFVLTPNVHGHFVDHGKLQFAPVTIGQKARINDGATVMPFTDISANVTLLTQCTTIKGGTLDSGIYMGNIAGLVKHHEELRASQYQDSLHKLQSALETQGFEDTDDLRIVIVGQQAFGAAVLQRLLERGENIVAVCGNPTKSGEADDPLISAAKNYGVEVYQTKSWKSPDALEKMKSFNADFCLMAYVTKYFPPEVANTPKYGSACFHPSLLPLHRGPSAISWAIATGKETTGVSIFEPTEGLDEGPIIIQKACEIAPDDTLGDLYTKKLFPMGVDAMVECVDLVKNQQLTKQEQDLSLGSYESWFRGDAVLVDFTRNVNTIYNIIRAANPTPGADTSFNGITIKLYECRKTADKGSKPGMVVDINDEGVLVQSEGGCILVKRVESSDGKRLHASKWALEAGLGVGSTFDMPRV